MERVMQASFQKSNYISLPLHLFQIQMRTRTTAELGDRTVAHERLPSQAGVRIVNNLPNSIKSVLMLMAFKTRLKTTLIIHAFYSIDEFMANKKEDVLCYHKLRALALDMLHTTTGPRTCVTDGRFGWDILQNDKSKQYTLVNNIDYNGFRLSIAAERSRVCTRGTWQK
ncbi:hypothetical protein J6590_031740 [Homalodisca vitripennis]|nr:hypothetical protein J6590_031740 [Homalodisca vitripennis]